MHPTPNRGPSPAPFDFPVRFGDEPTVGGPPLRQRWKAQGAEGEIRALDERGLRELRERAVRMHDVEIEWHRVVLRCEARLAALLGFEAVAEAQGARPVRVSCRLLRYEASPGEV